jgi:hypothetical protein
MMDMLINMVDSFWNVYLGQNHTVLPKYMQLLSVI